MQNGELGTNGKHRKEHPSGNGTSKGPKRGRTSKEDLHSIHHTTEKDEAAGADDSPGPSNHKQRLAQTYSRTIGRVKSEKD